jgi:hypothetical protein
LQYTYYTVSALGVKVPQVIKRTLTSLQIMQFLVGASFALLHLFVSYTIPVSIPYEVIDKVVQSTTTTTVTSIASSVANTAALPTASGAAVAFLKKLVYRAAGEEGLAENIYQPTGESQYAQYAHGLADDVQHVLHRNPKSRTVYRTEYQHVPCIDTSGQAFAVYLNLIYLLPLTGLFMRFFVKSYLRRTSAKSKPTTTRDAIVNAGRDAIHGVDRELESLGRSAEDSISSGSQHAKNGARGRTAKQSDNRNGSLSPANQKFVDSVNRKVNQRLEAIGEGAKDTKERAKKIAKEVVSGSGSPKSDRAQSPEQKNGNGTGNEDNSASGTEDAKDKAENSKDKAENSKDKSENSKDKAGGSKGTEKSKIPKKSKDTKGQDAEKKDTEGSDATEDVNDTEVRAKMVVKDNNTKANDDSKPPGVGKVTAKPSDDDKTNGKA